MSSAIPAIREHKPGGAGAPEASGESTVVAPPAPRRRPPIGLFVLLAVFLGLAAFGAQRYVYGLSHVRTDNAQVEGHVIPVLPRVTGYVTAVHVSENQPVKEGDLLFELDDRDFRSRLTQSDADFAAARATAGGQGLSGQAEAQVAAARAAVLVAAANATRAEADLKRYRELAPRGVVSPQQLDAADANARVADAQLDATRKQVQAAEAGLQSAGARRDAAAAAIEQAKLNLAWTRITAPAAGVISRKNIEVGQLVQPGQPTMSVVPLDDVWIVANLKETEVRDVTPGDRVEVKLDSYPGRKFAGRVESISAATGAKFSLLPPDNATGNFTKVVQRIPVRIRLDRSADPERLFRPGMSADVVITTK